MMSDVQYFLLGVSIGLAMKVIMAALDALIVYLKEKNNG